MRALADFERAQRRRIRSTTRSRCSAKRDSGSDSQSSEARVVNQPDDQASLPAGGTFPGLAGNRKTKSPTSINQLLQHNAFSPKNIVRTRTESFTEREYCTIPCSVQRERGSQYCCCVVRSYDSRIERETMCRDQGGHSFCTRRARRQRIF